MIKKNMAIDNKVDNLLKGICNFFELKFPSENFNTNPVINEFGYHMTYLGVDYSINFTYEEGIRFELRAEYSKLISNLEEKINKIRISNKRLDKTKYLSNQQININSDCIDNNCINVSCRIKKIPTSERDRNFLCDQLWGFIIKNVFSSIHN